MIYDQCSCNKKKLPSNLYLSRTVVGNKLVDHSDIVLNIFIFGLTRGFNGLGKDNYKTRREIVLVFGFCLAYTRGLTVYNVIGKSQNYVHRIRESMITLFIQNPCHKYTEKNMERLVYIYGHYDYHYFWLWLLPLTYMSCIVNPVSTVFLPSKPPWAKRWLWLLSQSMNR